jgi:hypothetical protein
MQTIQAMILDELARWEKAQKDIMAVLTTNDNLTVADHSRLQYAQGLISHEIAKCKTALAEYPNVN